jgi:hypothetical protein
VSLPLPEAPTTRSGWFLAVYGTVGFGVGILGLIAGSTLAQSDWPSWFLPLNWLVRVAGCFVFFFAGMVAFVAIMPRPLPESTHLRRWLASRAVAVLAGQVLLVVLGAPSWSIIPGSCLALTFAIETAFVTEGQRWQASWPDRMMKKFRAEAESAVAEEAAGASRRTRRVRVRVDGKVRDQIEVAVGIGDAELETLALTRPLVAAAMAGKQPLKVVPKRGDLLIVR